MGVQSVSGIASMRLRRDRGLLADGDGEADMTIRFPADGDQWRGC